MTSLAEESGAGRAAAEPPPGSEPRLIDTLHLGRERVIGCWQVGDALVDPGPESCMETVLAAVEGPIRRLLLTHIHLDHAGATGALVERFPEIEVFVHRSGARHLADPSRLLASAERLYGEHMEWLWGRIVPVPEANLRPLDGGETLDGGIQVAYVPGHASHHVAYLADEVAYVGDVAGVQIVPGGHLLMPTPPPDIDVPAWLASIDLVREWAPRRLALTHFGAVEDEGGGEVARHLDLAAARLAEAAEQAERHDLDGFTGWVRGSIAADSDPATAAAYEQAAPPPQLYAGLRRYLEKASK